MKQVHIDHIRAFNRFYTNILGLLDGRLLNSQFTLLEVRIMFEMYNHRGITASEIISLLHLDKGYLSRTLKTLEKKRLIAKRRSAADGRHSHLELTQTGKKEFESLNQAANNQIKTIVKQLSDRECEELVNSMYSIKEILTKI